MPEPQPEDDLTPEQHAKLAVDGSVIANGACYIEASEDPRDLPVHAYQNVQWLHIQGDEIGLLNFAADMWRDAYDRGAKTIAEES